MQYTLYKKTSTGATQEWTIVQENDHVSSLK